jgi:hypothetical protein
VKPRASSIASVQPSAQEANNSSARRRSALRKEFAPRPDRHSSECPQSVPRGSPRFPPQETYWRLFDGPVSFIRTGTRPEFERGLRNLLEICYHRIRAPLQAYGRPGLPRATCGTTRLQAIGPWELSGTATSVLAIQIANEIGYSARPDRLSVNSSRPVTRALLTLGSFFELELLEK